MVVMSVQPVRTQRATIMSVQDVLVVSQRLLGRVFAIDVPAVNTRQCRLFDVPTPIIIILSMANPALHARQLMETSSAKCARKCMEEKPLDMIAGIVGLDPMGQVRANATVVPFVIPISLFYIAQMDLLLFFIGSSP
jgi:hypothetical protein